MPPPDVRAILSETERIAVLLEEVAGGAAQGCVKEDGIALVWTPWTAKLVGIKDAQVVPVDAFHLPTVANIQNRPFCRRCVASYPAMPLNRTPSYFHR
jgi:hypothetical protein